LKNLVCTGGTKRWDDKEGLVGGARTCSTTGETAHFSHLGFLGPDSFDRCADGYSRGEDFGAVVIKMLSQAIRDGDTIRSVIRAFWLLPS